MQSRVHDSLEKPADVIDDMTWFISFSMRGNEMAKAIRATRFHCHHMQEWGIPRLPVENIMNDVSEGRILGMVADFSCAGYHVDDLVSIYACALPTTMPLLLIVPSRFWHKEWPKKNFWKQYLGRGAGFPDREVHTCVLGFGKREKVLFFTRNL